MPAIAALKTMALSAYNWATELPPQDDLLKAHIGDRESHSCGRYDFRRGPFDLYRHVPDMVCDPRISICLEYVKGAILSLSRFYVDEGSDSDDHPSEIKKFVVKQISRWWRTTARKQLTALEWGYCAMEPMFHVCNGQISFTGAKRIEPIDAMAVGLKGELIGMQVKMKDKEPLSLRFPKCIWHVYGREHDPFYGRSKLVEAYEPWMDLHHHHGLLAVRRLYFFKYGFQGETMGFPEGKTYPDANGQAISADRMAMQMLEDARAGSVLALPSTVDPTTGARDWFLEPRPALTGATDIMANIDQLRNEISEGMDVPQEVIQASETGSGYSGRRVPQDAFRGMLSDIIYWLVDDFDSQVVRKLVAMNFGVSEPSYEIMPFGMVRDDDNDTEEGVTADGKPVPKNAKPNKLAS